MGPSPSSSAPERVLVVPAAEYRGDLLERLVEMHRALQARGEGLPVSWPEDALEELRAGRMKGWVAEGQGPSTATLILAVRRDRGFGHIHLVGPPSDLPTAQAALEAMARERPAELRRADLAVSADPKATEDAWGQELEGPGRPGPFTALILRRALLRSLEPQDPPTERPLPSGYRFLPGLSAGAARLAAVDLAAFESGPDAGMVAETLEDNERLLTGLFQGDLGPPIPEACPALCVEVEDESTGGAHLDVVGFAICLDQGAGVALLADIALLPSYQHRGLGKALLSRCLRALLATGHREVRLWVTEENLPARRLYDELGFRHERFGRILRWERDAPASPRS